MGLLFRYMDSAFARMRDAAEEARDHMFHVSLAVFERTILLTHKYVCVYVCVCMRACFFCVCGGACARSCVCVLVTFTHCAVLFGCPLPQVQVHTVSDVSHVPVAPILPRPLRGPPGEPQSGREQPAAHTAVRGGIPGLLSLTRSVSEGHHTVRCPFPFVLCVCACVLSCSAPSHSCVCGCMSLTTAAPPWCTVWTG